MSERLWVKRRGKQTWHKAYEFGPYTYAACYARRGWLAGQCEISTERPEENICRRCEPLREEVGS